jgi:branched-chain amino acid transport system ATP-binding protein
MLEIQNLHSYYGDAHVVQGATFTVRDREVVALLGRNGMGKTSIIRSIMGLAAPRLREGTVTWKGQNLVGLKPYMIAERRIALVPQGRRLFPSLTVTEHLTMLAGRGGGTWTPERIFEMFPRLAERRRNRGNELSGGERQMLAVGRALMLDPELVLMDEPSEGLAPVMVQHLEGIILQLKAAGLGILLVEQNLYSALAVADRVYVLETGRIVYEADAAAVAAAPETLTRFLGVH